MNNFTLRTITGAIFVLVIIGSVLINHWLFASLFFVIALAGFWEFSLISRSLNVYPAKITGILMSALTYIIIVCWNFLVIPDQSLYFLLLIPVIILSVELSRKTTTSLLNTAMTLFGIVWIILPLALL